MRAAANNRHRGGPGRPKIAQSHLTQFQRTLKEALSEHAINALGRKTGQTKRMRVVTPFRLLRTLLVAMAVGATETLADLCREFNFQNGTSTAYKAFYMRLARPAFPKFMRAVAQRLMNRLAVRVLQPEAGSPLARFTDIVIQDGSSFAVKRELRGAFPGRFKTVEPAAVEVHVTFSGFQDEVIEAHVSPDTSAERHFLPKPARMGGKLLLADRGYPSRPYFEALGAAGAHFVVRLTRSWRPWVLASHGDNGCSPLPKPIRLSHFLAQHPDCPLDLDIELRKGKRGFGCRLVVLLGKDPHRSWLCTNLPRDDFSLERVGHIYRFRGADRAPLQGMEVVRQPPQVQHSQQVHRPWPHLGEPRLSRPQALHRPRGGSRGGPTHFHTQGRDVRSGFRPNAPRRCHPAAQIQSCHRRDRRLPASQRPTCKPEAG